MNRSRPNVVREYIERVRCVIWNRKMIKSKRLDSLGLVPEEAGKGDCKFTRSNNIFRETDSFCF